MTRRKLSFLQGTQAVPYKLPAEDHRLNHAGLWVPDSVGGGLRVRSGIVAGPGNPGKVSVVAGGTNVNPFQAVIQGTLNGTQGEYEAVSDAVEFRAITAASSTEFRRGYVVARVYDQLNAGTGAVKDDWDIEVVYGPNAATAGAATLPPLPANTLVLREFAVSNTGVITLAGSTPPWTVARGGVQPVATDDAVPGAYIGQYRDHPTEGLQRWDGAAWIDPVRLPLCVVRQTAPQTLTTTAWTPLTWGVAEEDETGMWTSQAADRVTIKRKGMYWIQLFVTTGVPNNRVGAQLQVDGVAVSAGTANYQTSASGGTAPSPRRLVRLNPGQYVRGAGVAPGATVVVGDSASLLSVECARLLP